MRGKENSATPDLEVVALVSAGLAERYWRRNVALVTVAPAGTYAGKVRARYLVESNVVGQPDCGMKAPSLTVIVTVAGLEFTKPSLAT